MRTTLFVLGSVLSAVAFAGEFTHLTVTAASHESHVSTSTTTLPGSATSNTSCNGVGMQTGPLATATVNCQTNTYGSGPQTIETSRLDVRNVVEGNGQRFTIVCTGHWVGTNCAPMIDGDQFEAEYDGERTMWVNGRKGGNLGKPIRTKYHVVDVRAIPQGQATAAGINDALKAAALRHPDFPRYEQAMERLSKISPAGAMGLDDYVEALYRRAKSGEHVDTVALNTPSIQPTSTVTPSAITLRFVSNPAGAEVDVDGTYWGSTPTADLTRLLAGTHTITVKKLGFVPWERKVELAPGDDRTVNAELEVDPTKPHIAGL